MLKDELKELVSVLIEAEDRYIFSNLKDTPYHVKNRFQWKDFCKEIIEPKTTTFKENWYSFDEEDENGFLKYQEFLNNSYYIHINGAAVINGDDNDWTLAILPHKYKDLKTEDIVNILWPKKLDYKIHNDADDQIYWTNYFK